MRSSTLAALLLAASCSGPRSAPPPPPPQVEVAPARTPPDPVPAEAAPEEVRAEPAAPAPDVPSNPRENPMEGRPLGWIAGQPLEPAELLVEWADVSSRELYLLIDKIVAARLALAEARRLGIRLDPEMVEQRVAAERAELERRLPGTGSIDERIRRELGFEPSAYLERVRRATIRQVLAERAVRLHSLQSESLALRLIVVPDEETLVQVQEALAAGRDFADVAREMSVDDSAGEGGLVPFVIPEERSSLARLAFQTPVGEVTEPVAVADHHLLLRVEERRTPLEGDWSTLADAVEASLEQYPVLDSEFVHWRLVIEGRYPIDLGPLWSLIGAAH
jgi:hypothetical protein